MRISSVLSALLCPLLFAFWSANAVADWHVASSEHFVVYADARTSEVRRFAERIERFHGALSSVFALDKPSPSPSNRMTIYVVQDEQELQSLRGARPSASIQYGAVYVPRAGDSLAFVPSVRITVRGDPSFAETQLMHFYAHHFLYEHVPFILPRWYIEGFTTYFSTATFEGDGSVNIGLPLPGGNDTVFATDVAVADVLDSTTFRGSRSARDITGLYRRGWQLMHYVFSNEEGRRNVTRYLALLNNGTPELQAATDVFGDLETLDSELHRYIRGKLIYWKLDGEQLPVAPIAVRKLDDGEAAIMPVVLRSKADVDAETAAETVATAREIAAGFPAEAAVQAALAEAEFGVGNDEAAIAAADRALAADPAHITALIQKGKALMRIASETGAAEAWTRARRQALAINKVEVDHPLALTMYYQTFALQNAEPSETAVQGLEWALQLAPYDRDIRMLVAQRQMDEARYADAIVTLSPLAYHPHTAAGGDNPALTLLESAEAKLAEQRAAEAPAE